MVRPTKLTDAIERSIIADIRKGAHQRQAARGADVPDSTFSGWLANPGERYERFRAALERAEAEAEIEAVDEVRRTDKRWWLERRHPERWGRPTESRAQAAAVLQVGMAPAPSSEDPYVHLTAEDWRIASTAYLEQKRAERGEPRTPLGGHRGLDHLIVEDLGPDHPGEEYD